MTSPTRRRRQRSQQRFTLAELAEAVTIARSTTNRQVDLTATAPLTRNEMRLVRRAVREGWDTSPEKQAEYLNRLQATVQAPDDELAIFAIESLLMMDEFRLP